MNTTCSLYFVINKLIYITKKFPFLKHVKDMSSYDYGHLLVVFTGYSPRVVQHTLGCKNRNK